MWRWLRIMRGVMVISLFTVIIVIIDIHMVVWTVRCRSLLHLKHRVELIANIVEEPEDLILVLVLIGHHQIRFLLAHSMRSPLILLRIPMIRFVFVLIMFVHHGHNHILLVLFQEQIAESGESTERLIFRTTIVTEFRHSSVDPQIILRTCDFLLLLGGIVKVAGEILAPTGLTIVGVLAGSSFRFRLWPVLE